MVGHIHSIESFGTVDGPGVRMVVFTKGCPMRCLYCHNPDTWEMSGGTDMTSEEILEQFEKNRTFYKTGGITVTGGEPLMQIDFVTDLFEKAKEKNIHTCLDTSGVTFRKDNTEKFDRLVKVTDLVMLDIKVIDPQEHLKLCSQPLDNILDFTKYLEEKEVPVWIRHVLVPEHSDFDEDLDALGDFIDTLSNVDRVEILPYHTLGKFKWENLGIPYTLESISPPSAERIENAKQRIHAGIRKQ